MEKLVLLNSKEHETLCISSPAMRDRHFVQIVPGEFASAATACPILFTKNPDTGAFYAAALFGFKPGENLVSGDQPFIPLDAIREGFFIAEENIGIDPEDDRFDRHEGDPLFEAGGAPSPALRRIQQALAALKTGMEESDTFIKALVDHRLVEPLDVTLNFDDGERLTLEGLYTVSLDALQDLDDTAAIALFRAGHLQLAYTMIVSLKQISALAERRNRAIARQAEATA